MLGLNIGHGLYHGIGELSPGQLAINMVQSGGWWVGGTSCLSALFVFHLNIKNILVEKILIGFGAG